MKACILTTSFPRYPGDYAGNFVFQLAEALIERGIKVKVVAPSETGPDNEETLGHIEVRRFAYTWPFRWQRVAYLGGIPSNLRRYWQAWLQLPLFIVFFFLRSYRACKECDVVHAYWIIAGFVGVILSRLLKKPLVLTVQGSDINFMWGNPLLDLARRFVLERADAIIAVSQELAQRVRTLCRSDSMRVLVIPNGVDEGVFHDCHSSDSDFLFRLAWSGRMSEEKGLRYLLDAMPAVLAEYPPTTLTLVGDGPLREILQQQVERLDINASVSFSGRVTHEEVVGYLCEADVFVFPSLNEGLPLSILEAMSVGLPVIASRVGGIPDVIREEGEARNGAIVPARDPAALADAIIRLFERSGEARRLGQAGRALIRNEYTWARIAERTVDLYAKVV